MHTMIHGMEDGDGKYSGKIEKLKRNSQIVRNCAVVRVKTLLW